MKQRMAAAMKARASGKYGLRVSITQSKEGGGQAGSKQAASQKTNQPQQEQKQFKNTHVCMSDATERGHTQTRMGGVERNHQTNDPQGTSLDGLGLMG